MRASEWQFLCAVHDAPKSCCAIDYCCHTLDWAANVVTNPKIFPSRFVAPAPGDGHDRGAAMKNLVNVFRRLHRIFAHAWFQHRGVFWSVEGQTGLYVFFKTVCDLYDLLPAENYKLPPEAEGLEAPATERHQHQAPNGAGHHPVAVTAIARPPSAAERPVHHGGDDDDGSNSAAARTNTRRHIRSNPSTGNAISMVPEVDEDDQHHPAAGLAARMKEMSLSAPAPAAPAPQPPQQQPPPTVVEQQQQQPDTEAADVPVIVLDDGKAAPPPPRRDRETRVETIETTEHDEKDRPSEAEAPSVVLENELERGVLPEPSGDQDTAEPAASAQPEKTGAEKGEGGAGEVGDETVIPLDDEEEEEGEKDAPAETESKPNEAADDVPLVSAVESEDLETAVAKEDPEAAAAVVVANSEEREDVKEEEETADGEDKAKDEKATQEERKEETEGE